MKHRYGSAPLTNRALLNTEQSIGAVSSSNRVSVSNHSSVAIFEKSEVKKELPLEVKDFII